MTGQTIAHYRVGEKIGAGGMGEVYRATDTRLGRDVALKVLPEAFISDAQRMARFAREAQLLASLNHAHIAALYGLEESGATRALAMELVDGPTLDERVGNDGPFPMDEALPIARQMTEALEYAHERGVIHRDLKPANVKLTSDGHVKVLDFGLAKAMSTDSTPADMANSPTLTQAATQAGVILGTAAYMPPEQARGKSVDRRADIWSFGCVLYEMLTGRRVFPGETVSDTLAAVLRAEPDWSALPQDTPAALRRLLRRCLEKDPRQRLRDIGEARIALEEIIAHPQADTPGASLTEAGKMPALPAWRRALPWAAAGVFAVLAAVLALLMVGGTVQPASPVRSSILPPPDIAFHIQGSLPGPAAISPDGRMVAFAGRDKEGRVRLFVHSLDSGEARPLEGAEGAQYPFWSPDSRSLGFFGGGKLKRVELAGGLPVPLADGPNGKGGTWSGDGTILFAPTHSSPLYRIAAAGGEATPLTTVDGAGGEDSHRHPRFLPGGKRFLYFVRVNRGEGELSLHDIRVGSLDGSPPVTLLQANSQAEYAAGYLFYSRGRSLFAQPFDVKRLAFTGDPEILGHGLDALGGGAGYAIFSVSGAGTLLYQTGESNLGINTLVWKDRQGKDLSVLGPPANYIEPDLSPDARRVAVVIREEGSAATDVWLVDIERGIRTRFTTSDRTQKYSPVWSPDGRSLAYSRMNSERREEVFLAPVAGTGAEKKISADGQNFNEWPQAFSPDGRYLLVARVGGPYLNTALMALPLRPDAGPAIEIREPKASVGGASFSPDGRWLAYGSFQSGTWHVYVTAFPALGRRWQVSRDNGLQPTWGRGGQELVYLTQPATLVAVEVSTKGETLEILGEQRLSLGEMLVVLPYRYKPYALNASHSRAVVVQPQIESGREGNALTLLQNWPAALGRKR